MGKRLEKAFAKDKSASAKDGSDDANKTPDIEPPPVPDDPNKPYVCNGHFHTDFAELCKREGLIVPPPVVLRAKRPASPSQVPVVEEKTKGKGGDKKNSAAPPPPPPPAEGEGEVELDENGDPIEPAPKTYTTRDKYAYFKPTVQVEMDNPDKEDTVTQVFIRGWKIDVNMMTIFKQCWQKLDRLHTLNLWSAGLTDDSLALLSTILPDCANLKSLYLDNNPVTGQGYHQLIQESSPLLTLSLRYNQITDRGVELISYQLGTTQAANMKLLSLNLTGNHITDVGAAHIANALRTNRTLLSLGLAKNNISSQGAKKLAEVLSHFALTHEEIVERRKLLSEKPNDGQKSEGEDEGELTLRPHPTSRRSDSRDRPQSVRSSNKNTKSKSAKDKKDGTKGETKGKKDDRTKKGSIAAEGKGKDKGKTKGKNKPNTVVETETIAEPVEPSDIMNPLLDYVERLDKGTLMIPGNRTLINLNLSNNKIEEDGIAALLLAIGYQTTIAQDTSASKIGGTGLMRLCLQRNLVPRDCETLTKLNNLMQTKDPFYKPPILTPDLEQH